MIETINGLTAVSYYKSIKKKEIEKNSFNYLLQNFISGILK